MKKKLLLLAVMVLAIISVFAITASAAETTVENENFQGGVLYKSTTNEFGTVNYVADGVSINSDSYLDSSARVVLKNADGTYSTYPTYYLMKGSDWQGPYFDYATLSALSGEEYAVASVARIEIPEGATGIRSSSFQSSTELVYVKIASTVTALRSNSFQNCSNLTTVEFAYDYEKYPEFGSALTQLTNGAVFSGCTSLTKLVFPNSLKTTHNNAFVGCSSLKELNLGASYESCGQVCGAPANLEKLVLSTTFIPGSTRFTYNAVSKASFSTNLVIYYTGSYDQAVELQSNETNTYEIKYGTLISYDDFTDESFVRDTTVHYFVYGYNACDAFYNGIHNYTGTGDCLDGVECTQCKDEITDFTSHSYKETLVYGSFTASGLYNKYCTNASDCAVGKITDRVASAIFTFNEANGFSVNGKGGIALGGYEVNHDALSEYNRINTPIRFGMMVVNPDQLYGKDSFLDAGGKINTNGMGAQVDMSNSQYANISVSITGLTNGQYSLVIALYAYSDIENVEYIQSKTTRCASENVTVGTTTLYTVTLDSATEGNIDISSLGDYVIPSKKENL